MGLMDKFKNLFTEEVEEEEPITKEVIQVEIPSPKEEKKPKREKRHIEEEPIVLEKEEEPQYEAVREEIKEEYKFPFFDDDDFETIEEKQTPKREKKKDLYKEAYKPAKEEKKVFKPTPIISPVYGILDKNYVKEDIKPKNTRPSSYYNPKEATIDEIRNKAYGTLEEDVEHELYDRDPLYEPIDVLDNKKTDDLFEEIDREVPPMPEEEAPRHAEDNKNDELTSLLEAEMSKEAKKTAPSKISDEELRNLIDSMYDRGGK
jgi:hypothetical protein